jgi:hypothetical protein
MSEQDALKIHEAQRNAELARADKTLAPVSLAMAILAVAVGAWLLYTQQQFFNVIVAYVGALGAAAGVIFKLVGDLRAKFSSSGGGAQ